MVVERRERPKAGDVMLGCIHRPSLNGAHIYQTTVISFQRPDGSVGKATWIALCDGCFCKHADDPAAAPIGCDLEWPENAELQYKETS